jgi:hypothetical protein
MCCSSKLNIADEGVKIGGLKAELIEAGGVRSNIVELAESELSELRRYG